MARVAIIPAVPRVAAIGGTVNGVGISITERRPFGTSQPPVPDTTPDAFTFADANAVTASSTQTSNTITVSGLGSGDSATVSITGGTYSKNGGAYGSSATTAVNGDTFAVRHTASANASTSTNTTLTIGGIADTFTSTTAAAAALISAVAPNGYQATYAGDLSGKPMVEGTSEFTNEDQPVTVAGFDGTAAAVTPTKPFRIQKRIRQVYNNQGLANGSEVALARAIYSSDLIGGNPTGSALTSPLPMANWCMVDRLLTGNTCYWEITPWHVDFENGQQVAAVRVRANDGTNQTTWQTVNAPTLSSYCEEPNPCETFSGTLNLGAVAANGGAYWLEGEVYPFRGDANSVLKSEDGETAGHGPREFVRRYFYRHDTRAANPPRCYVGTGAGNGTPNDTTGVFSPNDATARANPFATVAAAQNAFDNATRGILAANGFVLGDCSGAEIRISDNTAAFASPSVARTQSLARLVITRDPNVARANAVITLSAGTSFKLTSGLLAGSKTEQGVLFQDVTVARTANVAWQGTSGNNLNIAMRNITLANGTTAGKWLSTAHDLLFGVNITGTLQSQSFAAAVGAQHRIIRGVTATGNSTSSDLVENYLIMGSTFTGLAHVTTTLARDDTKPYIVYNSKFFKLVSASCAFDAGAFGNSLRIVDMQNVYEVLGPTNITCVIHSADGGSGSIAHAVIGYMTGTGYRGIGRINSFYDEHTTATNRRQHKNVAFFGILGPQFNSKGDVFVGTSNGGTPNPTEAPNRTGHFWVHHGVGTFGNLFRYKVNSGTPYSEAQAYAGPGSLVSASATVANYASSVIWNGYAGMTDAGAAGVGLGDYSLKSGSPARGIVSRSGLSKDISGAARTNGADSAGAFA